MFKILTPKIRFLGCQEFLPHFVPVFFFLSSPALPVCIWILWSPNLHLDCALNFRHSGCDSRRATSRFRREPLHVKLQSHGVALLSRAKRPRCGFAAVLPDATSVTRFFSDLELVGGLLQELCCCSCVKSTISMLCALGS